ncbi:hypothetical protein ABB02_01671 [Clostridiaceae bacterium JG1575]|nr:hypothetical protein ABB02_01671 [Clostridiaceae bacterium JG1575]
MTACKEKSLAWVIEPYPFVPCDLSPLAAAAHAEGFGMLKKLLADYTQGHCRYDGKGEALLVAHDEAGTVLGCAALRCKEGRAILRRFYVHPKSRRRGVGRALLRALTNHLPSPTATLYLKTDTQNAVAFYQSEGFLETHRKDGFIFMERTGFA